MSNQWFRSWHGAPTDPKWLGIGRKAGVAPGIVAALVWALLDRASQASERGSIAGYDADGLACFFGCEAEQVEAIIAAMRDKGIIDGDKFAAWEKHQPKREDDSTERVKAYRERKATPSPANETQCNAPKHAETLDTDTDTDEREKKAHAQQEKPVKVDVKADPAHFTIVQSILDDRQKLTLTKSQREHLDAIQSKLGARDSPAECPVVKRGSKQFTEWIAHKKSLGLPTAYLETKDFMTVPTEYPPSQEQAA
jgi:hypothetical protein